MGKWLLRLQGAPARRHSAPLALHPEQLTRRLSMYYRRCRSSSSSLEEFTSAAVLMAARRCLQLKGSTPPRVFGFLFLPCPPDEQAPLQRLSVGRFAFVVAT